LIYAGAKETSSNKNAGLDTAVKANRVKTVRFLRVVGTYANAFFDRHIDKESETALHVTCDNRNKDIVKILPMAGVNTDTISKYGRALTMAFRSFFQR
jgi:hypothetical protein